MKNAIKYETIKKFTVAVTKDDGAESTYLVIATSKLGAEHECLENVYGAKYALASDGWNSRQTWPDLISKAAGACAVLTALNGSGLVIEHKNLLEDALDQGDEVLLRFLRFRPTAYLAADIRDLLTNHGYLYGSQNKKEQTAATKSDC